MGEKIRKTGIDILGNVPWGTHFCQFYHTREDLIDILVPYFKAGLENNEFCMWVTSELFSEKEAKKAMRMAVPNFDRYLKRGQIEIVPYEEWYLKEGNFNLHRVPNAWIDKLDQALAQGYDGIRVTGNTAWLEKRDWRNFTEYEKEVNNVIDKYRMMAICSYSLDKCGVFEVIDVVTNHQFALIKREGKWELIESSERKRAEEEKEKLQTQLIHSEKMAGIGTMASGIAHEFNNLLQIVRGHVEFAQRTKKAEHMEEALDIVLKKSDEVAKIIGNLLTFSRPEASEKELCDITEAIESVLSLTEEHLKKNNIEVVRKYEMTPQIEVNKAEMQQVFLNIVTNARDAMLPKGGKLEIETKRIKENLEVSISDTGKGIDKENLGKLFEPFYTTKRAIREDSKFQGTGLGLSVSYGIVKRHGGTIEVKSEMNKGTTFTVKLPLKE